MNEDRDPPTETVAAIGEVGHRSPLRAANIRRLRDNARSLPAAVAGCQKVQHFAEHGTSKSPNGAAEGDPNAVRRRVNRDPNTVYWITAPKQMDTAPAEQLEALGPG